MDPYLGALTIESNEFDIPARGLNLSLGAKFNSDYLYLKYLSALTGSETSAGRTLVRPANQVYTLPGTTVQSGWFYELPYCTFATAKSLVLVLDNGAKYDLSSCVTAWTSMAEESEQDYGAYRISKPDATHIDILIPEVKIGIKAEISTSYLVSSVDVYFEGGTYAHFSSSGTLDYMSDASGKNRLTYTFDDKTLQSVSHSDGRTVKILNYTDSDGYSSFVYLLSTSAESGILNEGDRFLARRVFDGDGHLRYSDSLETQDFEAVESGFVLTADNESDYFHSLQRTTYVYSLSSTVTGDFFTITEPGGAYRTYTFDVSFGPGMVSRYYYYYSTKYFLYTEYTHVYQVEYQNKPKVVSEKTQKTSGDTEYRKTDYIYNGNYKNLFTASDYHYYYQGTYGGGTGAGYPTPYNTQPANTQKTTYKVTPSETDYLVGETVTYAHETSNPYNYKGISQDLVLAYDGTTSGTCTEYEKMTRTFTEIYGNYYPEVETTYRGGSTTAARTITNTYDGYGRVITRNNDLTGNTCYYYLYEGSEGDASFSYPNDYPITLEWGLYSAFGALGGIATQVAASQYQKTYYEYDTSLNVAERVVKGLSSTGGSLEDATTTYGYNSSTNVLISQTDPVGDTITLSYGTGWESSYVVKDSQTLSDGTEMSLCTWYGYDIQGRMTLRKSYVENSLGEQVTDSRYPVSSLILTFDGLGRVLSATRKNADASTVLLQTRTYDDDNLTILVTDARGYQAFTQFDEFFRPVDRYAYRPDTDGRTASYDGTGRAELSHTTYTYDPAQPQLLLTQTNYLASGDTDPFVLTYTYDTLGRRTKAERSRSGTTVTVSETSYDDLANAETKKTYRTETEYTAVRVDKDWLDRPEVESAWTGANQTGTQLNTQYAYDMGGRLISKTLPSGEVYVYTYDSAGRLTAMTYPNGRLSETCTYDLDGRLLTSTDLNGNVTTLTYNPAGLVERKTVTRNSVLDETVDTTYCPYGPLTVKKYPGSPTLPELEYEYRYGPDGLVREESRTLRISGSPYTSTVARELDDAGNLTSLTVSGLSGFEKTVTYSAPGFGEAVPGVTGYNTTAYNSTGVVVATAAASRLGLAALAYGSGQVTTYAYDSWLGLSGIDNPDTAYDQVYTRDYTGKIASWANSIDTRSFTYDGLGRLSAGEDITYTYDTTGNMTTATGGDPSSFAYLLGSTGSNSMLIDSTNGAATVDYSTDTKGNVVQAASRFGTISYDFSNRITSISDTARGVTDTYDYDASGLRYRKTESVAGTPVQTFTVYSGNDILLEETYSQGAWKTARIEFSVAGAKAGRFEKDFSTSQEALRYYYQDHLGSRIGVADESGAVLATVAYDVWGNATASGIAGYDAESEIRFTGKPMDATGLYYFNARYYDPQSKRFFTEDPIQSGMNWYTYCGNDPVNLRDPEGLRPAIGSNNASGDTKEERDSYADYCRAEAETRREIANENLDRRPDEPYTQKMLPNSPNGKSEGCLFRSLLAEAEKAAGYNFSLRELLGLWAESLQEEEIRNDSFVNDAEAVLKRAFEKLNLTQNPYVDLNSSDAKGTIIKLTKMIPVDTGVKSLHMYDTGVHYQNGNPDGTLYSDPWGKDLSKTTYTFRREIHFYVHY